MKYQELKDLIKIVLDASEKIKNKSFKLDAYARRMDKIVNNEFSSALFPNDDAVNAFVALQSPIYANILTELETETDALGTDLFH